MKKAFKIWRFIPIWFRWLLISTVTYFVLIWPYEQFFDTSIVLNVFAVGVIPFIILVLVPMYVDGGEINRQRELEDKMKREREQKEIDRLNGIFDFEE